MRPERRPATCTSAGFTAFRFSGYDSPFWSWPNTTSARWHRAGKCRSSTCSLHPDGAWCELIRHENLRSESEVELVRTLLWIVQIDVSRVADYSTDDKSGNAGFDPLSLTSDDHVACQEEGARLRNLGCNGVLAPSAALPGALNLTVFGARLPAPWRTTPQLASYVPCAIVARGGPRPGLVERTTYLADAPPRLPAWQRALARPRSASRRPRSARRSVPTCCARSRPAGSPPGRSRRSSRRSSPPTAASSTRSPSRPARPRCTSRSSRSASARATRC